MLCNDVLLKQYTYQLSKSILNDNAVAIRNQK